MEVEARAIIVGIREVLVVTGEGRKIMVERATVGVMEEMKVSEAAPTGKEGEFVMPVGVGDQDVLIVAVPGILIGSSTDRLVTVLWGEDTPVAIMTGMDMRIETHSRIEILVRFRTEMIQDQIATRSKMMTTHEPVDLLGGIRIKIAAPTNLVLLIHLVPNKSFYAGMAADSSRTTAITIWIRTLARVRVRLRGPERIIPKATVIWMKMWVKTWITIFGTLTVPSTAIAQDFLLCWLLGERWNWMKIIMAMWYLLKRRLWRF
jgi:hypothetical protein